MDPWFIDAMQHRQMQISKTHVELQSLLLDTYRCMSMSCQNRLIADPGHLPLVA